MATEVWFRNPDNYIRECVEVLADRFAWDRGYLHKRSIDPTKLVELYLPATFDYRMLVVGDQGSAELRRGHTMGNPFAVYPTWEHGEDSLDKLVQLLAYNVGESEEACAVDLPPDERPVYGQEHRVVVIRPPNYVGAGRKFMQLLSDLQDEFAHATIHVHGLYSWRAMFGTGVASVDADPRVEARYGRITMPSGKRVRYEEAAKNRQWITLCGFAPKDLAVARNRCMYNMRAAWWAARHFDTNTKFRVRGNVEPDIEAVDYEIPETKSPLSGALKPLPGDKFACDICSLQNRCKYFRVGGVCSIPDSEPAGLARFFKTRDADTIIDGLGRLLATQGERLEQGLSDEREIGQLDSEVTKIANSLFANGVKLAKLVNPQLAAAGAPKLGVQVNVGHTRPNALTAKVVAELEAKGIARDDITPEMVKAVLDPPPPIDAQVINRGDT